MTFAIGLIFPHLHSRRNGYFGTLALPPLFSGTESAIENCQFFLIQFPVLVRVVPVKKTFHEPGCLVFGQNAVAIFVALQPVLNPGCVRAENEGGEDTQSEK